VRLYLVPERGCDVEYDALGKVASACGIPFLTLLPVELVDSVHEISADTPFWRFASALTLAHRLSAAPPEPQGIVNLTDIAS